jgi:hypothetical protein
MSKRKQTIYLLIMALGGVAVLLDRCVLSRGVTTPSAASAGVEIVTPPDPSTAPTRIHPAAPAEVEPDLQLAVPEVPFPRGLPLWDGREPLRDVFSRTTNGLPDNDSSRSGQDGRAAPSACADFAGAHRLEAVLVQERLRIAVVNGRWLRVGETVDGCTLIEIVGENGRFRCRDGEIVLSLKPVAGGP